MRLDFFFNFGLKMYARIYRYLTTIYEGALKYFGQGSATLRPSNACVYIRFMLKLCATDTLRTCIITDIKV